MRRAVAVLSVAVGIVLIAIPLLYSLFGRTADAERILDRFEFLTLGDNPARYLAEARITRTGSTELVEEAMPALMSEANVDEAKFEALVAAQEAIPAASEFSVRYSRQLASVDEKFQSVYDIPAAGLPLTATPWLFLGGGLAFVLVGVAVLRTSGRGPLVILALLGAATLVAPVALGGLSKSADADDVKDFASRGLSARAAAAAKEASAALDALVDETRSETLPLLADRQATTPRELEQELRRDHPAAATFLSEWRTIGPRLSRLADAVAASVSEFASARKMPVTLPVWLLLAAGLVTSLAAAGVLARERKPAGQ